ncbi:hypothetical protein RJI07_05760 [Mycoplasmatota bacterium WC30]
MNKILKEYNSWLVDNQKFVLHLRSHDSSLYTRLMPIYEVLNFISSEVEDNGVEFNKDLEKIFQIGLEYIHSQVFTCKTYLKTIFKDDFHDFMMYDRIIGYILYLEDLRYELVENNLKFDNKIINDLAIHLEDIMVERKEIPENTNLYVDSEIQKVISSNKIEFHSIIDIFIEIAETLGMSLYYESDYVIGKDI